MKPVFADTSFFVAICNPRDGLHRMATEVAAGVHREVVTTEFVLLELGNWLSRSGDRSVFVALVAQLEADPHARVIPADSALFRRGLELYTDRCDKNWSLTDCISFVVMREAKVLEALTADHHFEQAGFAILLK